MEPHHNKWNPLHPDKPHHQDKSLHRNRLLRIHRIHVQLTALQVEHRKVPQNHHQYILQVEHRNFHPNKPLPLPRRSHIQIHQ